jgi:ABC-type bacteriocin/lantibiotic exporter with double-glycine peptidase domain
MVIVLFNAKIDASVLIMDEATTGLDHETEQTIFNNLVKRNITIIIISHNSKLERFCNKVITLENGKLK